MILSKMINLFSKADDFMKSEKNKSISAGLHVSTCPPGQVLAGPDMTEVRVLVQFGTFRVQKWYFDEMT